ncbi:MAG: hypothetical protein ABL927_09225, partial [Bdellovibrionales bacterium]
MTNALILFFSITLILTGCDASKKIFGKFKSNQTPNSASNANSTATKAAPACPNGSSAQVLAGDCEGVWKINKIAGKTECEFVWGPKITCPIGSKSLSLEASCYGSTTKSVSTNENINSE